MRFDLTDLRLFLHVAESGSITAGADRAALALASASARIRGMEDTLGTPLLDRGPRGVTPTPAGRALRHHAMLLLGQVEHMRGDLRAYARGLKGHVRLMANTSAATESLPDPLARFLAARPEIDIDLEVRPSHAIVESVAGGQCDLGIAADSTEIGGLESYPFARDRLVLAVARSHRLSGSGPLPFRAALDEPFVGLDAHSVLQAHVARHAAAEGKPLSPRIRMTGFDGVCRMVAAGVGIAVLPRTAVARARRALAIAAVPLTDAWTARRLLICVRSLDALPAPARDLVGHLRTDRVSAEPPTDPLADPLSA